MPCCGEEAGAGGAGRVGSEVVIGACGARMLGRSWGRSVGRFGVVAVVGAFEAGEPVEGAGGVDVEGAAGAWVVGVGASGGTAKGRWSSGVRPGRASGRMISYRGWERRPAMRGV